MPSHLHIPRHRHVVQDLAPHGWTDATGAVLISPAIGAAGRAPTFTLTLAHLTTGSCLHLPDGDNRQRFLYVRSGALEVNGETLPADHFAYLPVDRAATVTCTTCTDPTDVLVFEQPWEPAAGLTPPTALLTGNALDAPAQPFMGDPHARLAPLLPATPDFDLAVNRFTFDPGTTLPFSEMHHNDHGLYMLAGQGVYRLGDGPDERWYDVAEDDCLWMAPFCPQWFAATADKDDRGPATYLYCKNVNRRAR